MDMTTSFDAGTWTSMSQGSTSTTTTEDIKVADDYDELFDIADMIGVNLVGLDEIDEMKERLLMHLRKNEGFNDKSLIIDSMADCHKDDKRKRESLVKMLKKCEATLIEFQVPEVPGRIGKRGSQAIEDLLRTEGTSKNFEVDFKEKLNLMTSGECTVVVSGETSSGKSSTLNLLFGMEVLPVHHNSCTSVITRISYDKKYSSTVIFNDGNQKTFTDPTRIKEDLWEMIYVKDQAGRDLVTSIKEVHMKIPSDFLKCGIVLIDSPGIGENEAMDSVITDFVEEHEIMGFIYVIKSDNAGGVEEDRLINLVKLVLEAQKKKSENGMMEFDPKSAIFVCNRWDLVNREQQDEVFENAVKKLSECWPGLDPEQVIKISTYRAEKEQAIDPSYVTEQYKVLLNSIKNIYIKALQRKVGSTYKWMERVLIRCVHHLKSLVRNLDSSEKDMEDRMTSTRDKLENLRKRSKVVLDELKLRVAEKYKEVCDEFREELLKPYAKIAITQWIRTEVPELEEGQTWEDVKDEINLRISDRVALQLEKWEMETERVKSIQDMVVNEIKIDLRILQDDVDDIENDIQQTDSPSNSTTDIYRKSRRLTAAFIQPPSALQLGLSSSNSDLTLPVKLRSRLVGPVSNLMKNFRTSKLFDDRKIKRFQEDPCKMARERAEKMLKKLTHPENRSQDFLQMYINNIMNRPLKYLSVIEQNIPQLIETNEQVLEHVVSCRIDMKDSRSLYEEMMEGLEELKTHLMQYGHGHIFVDDFVNDTITIAGESGADSLKFNVSDIVLSNSTCREVNRRSQPRGLWTVLQHANLMRKENDKAVTIRMYLLSSGVEYTFPEVSKLRFLQHDSIAEFLGIHHSNAPTPAFVYDDHLKSVRRFLRSTLGNFQQEVSRIVEETAFGLEYLHRKNMVHMELNCNTVTVDPDGNVKLTGGCLPRQALFPMEREKVEVGDFVYLSPSVLTGNLYIACSDVYAFGLFLLEVVLSTQAFSQQRHWPLDRFIVKVKPYEMLDLDNTLQGVGEGLAELIKHCIQHNADDRPAMSVVVQRLSELNLQPEVVVSSSKRLKRPILKSKKWPEQNR